MVSQANRRGQPIANEELLKLSSNQYLADYSSSHCGALRETRGNPISGSTLEQRTAPAPVRVRECFTRYPTMGATMLSTVLVVVLILLLLGAIPSWPYSRGWGYGPSGLLGIVLIVVLILALTGRV